MDDRWNRHHPTIFDDTALPERPTLASRGEDSPLPLGTWVVAFLATEYNAQHFPVAWQRVGGTVINVYGVADRAHDYAFRYWYLVEEGRGHWLIPDNCVLACTPPEGE